MRSAFGTWLVTGTVAAVVAGALGPGCFYPDYQFDAEAGGGGSTSSGPTTSATTGGGATSTGTMATTTGTATTTSTTTGSGGEDCLNGVDDDGDQAVDCADPDCDAGYSCVDAIPTGWGIFGYLALAESIPGSEPGCPAEFPDTAYAGSATPIAPSAECSACSCDPPTNGVCTLPDMDAQQPGIDAVRVSDKPCGTNPVYVGYLQIPAAWDGTCFGTQGYLGNQNLCGSDNMSPCNVALSSNSPIVSGETCAPKGGVATVDPPTWAVSAKACGGATFGGGCGAGSVCLPRPGGSFQAGVCVAKSGDDACPAPFNDKHSYYDPAEIVDDRDCTACQCDPATGSTCAATVAVYSSNNVSDCSQAVLTTFTAGTCKNIPGNPPVFSKKLQVTQPPSGGSCGVSAGGALPTGGVTLGEPTTLCCLDGT